MGRALQRAAASAAQGVANAARAALAPPLAQNPAFLKTSWDKSEEWKSGEKHNQPAEVLGNFDDGSAARSHAELMRAATPEEEADLRIGLFFYGDEIEVSAASNRCTVPCALRAPRAP